MRPILFLMLLCTYGCAGVAEETPDAFVRAAESWVDFHIEDMIEIWGDPDARDAESATWLFSERNTICRNQKRYRRIQGELVEYIVRECAKQTSYAYRCRVDAGFDASGVIVDVSADSYRCDLVYENILQYLDSGYPHGFTR